MRKYKLAYVLIIILLFGCSKAKLKDIITPYSEKNDKSKVVIKDYNYLKNLKKNSKFVDMTNSTYYIFKLNNVEIILGEYNDNIGLTSIDLISNKDNIDNLVDEANKILKIKHDKPIKKEDLINEMKKVKKGEVYSSSKLRFDLQKDEDEYTIYISEFNYDT